MKSVAHGGLRVSVALSCAALLAVACGGEEDTSPPPSPVLREVAQWHAQWDAPGLRPVDRERLIDDLFDLLVGTESQFSELDLARLDVYVGSHMNFEMLDSNAAYESAMFSIDSGLEVSGPCELPPERIVPDEFEQRYGMVRIHCLTAEQASELVRAARTLAEETWLKPFLGSE